MRTSGKLSVGEVHQSADGIPLSRLTPPIQVPHYLFRQHLVERINKPAPHATFMVAPSGYGKSTLAAQAINQLDIPAIWYTIESSDSPNNTVTNVTSAIRREIPKFAPWAEEFFSGEFETVDWVIRICNELGKIRSEIVFVWDGADNFSSDHLDMTQAFINYSPKNVRFISLRRSMPEVSYARLASFDALTFISAADLKFTEGEIEIIANQNGLDYADPEIAKSLGAVQGWPAGIQLLAKQIARKDFDQPPVYFDGKTMVKSAVDHLGGKDRDFLESLIFYDVITGSGAIELSGESDAINHLDQMSNEGVFVTRLDSEYSIYRMNSLIREELQSRVIENKELWNKQAIKSAELALRNGDELRAIEIYSMLSMNDQAKGIAVKNIQSMMTQGNVTLLRKWAPQLGEAFQIPNIGTKVLFMYSELSVGNFDKAQVLLTEIESDSGFESFLENHAEEIAWAKARIAFSRGYLSNVMEMAKELPSESMIVPIGQMTRKMTEFRPSLMSAFILHDREKFTQFFSLAVEKVDVNDPYVQNISMPSMNAMDAFLDGRYKEAYTSATLALHGAEKFGVKGIFVPFEAAYVLSDVSLEFGDEQKSLEVIEKYLPLAIKAQQWPWVVGLLAKEALLHLQQGRVNQALTLIRQARDYVSGARFGEEIAYLADWHEIFVRVATNDFERIQELVFRLPDNSLTRYLLLMFQARKNPGEAARLASSIPADSEHQKFGKALFLAEATLSNPPVATRHLREALEIAAAHGYFRSFLNLSQECKSLLLDIAGKNPTVYMEQIAQGIRKQSNAVQHDGSGSDHALTKRELDILRRLATGLPITQIAATLHISNNTIKTHLKNVYRKMSVGSREEAVARGHELLLL